jgi:hypothetical protein
MLMPSAITPSPIPCRLRPITIVTRSEESAEMMHPAATKPSRMSSTRRLPYMSPRRPLIGVEMAAASNVEMSTHCESTRDVSSSSGSRGMIGVTSVCMSAASKPAAASVATIARSLGRRVSERRCRGVSDPESPSSLMPPAYARRATGPGWVSSG